MTAAETLRAAAEKLGQAAEAADTARPGPWQVGCAASVTSPREGGYEYVTGYTTSHGTAVAEWIVLAQPAMGTALAAVFDAWARMGDLDPDLLNRNGGEETIAVARLVLGDDCPGTRKEAHDA